jgi:hypothetical protein
MLCVYFLLVGVFIVITHGTIRVFNSYEYEQTTAAVKDRSYFIPPFRVEKSFYL